MKLIHIALIACILFSSLQMHSSQPLLPKDLKNRENFRCPDINSPYCTLDGAKRYKNACEAWKAYEEKVKPCT